MSSLEAAGELLFAAIRDTMGGRPLTEALYSRLEQVPRADVGPVTFDSLCVAASVIIALAQDTGQEDFGAQLYALRRLELHWQFRLAEVEEAAGNATNDQA